MIRFTKKAGEEREAHEAMSHGPVHFVTVILGLATAEQAWMVGLRRP
jgi:hypothetical protein